MKMKQIILVLFYCLSLAVSLNKKSQNQQQVINQVEIQSETNSQQSSGINYDQELLPLSYDQVQTVPFTVGLQVGNGFDIRTGGQKTNPFNTGSLTLNPSPAKNGQIKTAILKSTRDLAELLAVNAEIEGKYLTFSAKATFSYNNEYTFGSNQVVAVLTHKIDLGQELLDNLQLTLTDQAKSVLRGDPNNTDIRSRLQEGMYQFQKYYGNYFVAGLQKGCTLDVKITKTASDSASKEQIAASLAGSMTIGAFQGSMQADFKLNNAIQATDSNDRVEIIYQGKKMDTYFEGMSQDQMLNEINKFPQTCEGQIRSYILYPINILPDFVNTIQSVIQNSNPTTAKAFLEKSSQTDANIDTLIQTSTYLSSINLTPILTEYDKQLIGSINEEVANELIRLRLLKQGLMAFSPIDLQQAEKKEEYLQQIQIGILDTYAIGLDILNNYTTYKIKGGYKDILGQLSLADTIEQELEKFDSRLAKKYLVTIEMYDFKMCVINSIRNDTFLDDSNNLFCLGSIDPKLNNKYFIFKRLTGMYENYQFGEQKYRAECQGISASRVCQIKIVSTKHGLNNSYLSYQNGSFPPAYKDNKTYQGFVPTFDPDKITSFLVSFLDAQKTMFRMQLQDPFNCYVSFDQDGLLTCYPDSTLQAFFIFQSDIYNQIQAGLQVNSFAEKDTELDIEEPQLQQQIQMAPTIQKKLYLIKNNNLQ